MEEDGNQGPRGNQGPGIELEDGNQDPGVELEVDNSSLTVQVSCILTHFMYVM